LFSLISNPFDHEFFCHHSSRWHITGVFSLPLSCRVKIIKPEEEKHSKFYTGRMITGARFLWPEQVTIYCNEYKSYENPIAKKTLKATASHYIWALFCNIHSPKSF